MHRTPMRYALVTRDAMIGTARVAAPERAP
jgi:hypothetical protein